VPEMITERSQPASARTLYPPSNIAAALGRVRAQTFNVYAKTKRLLWQMCGSDFHEYRHVLEEQAEQLLTLTDAITACMCNLGGMDVRPIDHSDLSRRSIGGNVEFVASEDVLTDLRVDNQILAGSLRSAQALCQKRGDIVAASLIDVWIDETRRRAWLLFEMIHSV
jgi:starvation-inducible DNA-binding protein